MAPLTLTIAQLEEIREECMAEDVDIDIGRMHCWTAERARTYFENGGEDENETRDGPGGEGRRGVVAEARLRLWLHAAPAEQPHTRDGPGGEGRGGIVAEARLLEAATLKRHNSRPV